MPEAKKPKLSPTRIAAFLACRMMYRYEYVDKIGRFYHRSSPGNSFGATIHQALHDFHVAGGALVESTDALVARAVAVWRSVGYESSEQEAERRVLAGNILARYHQAELARVGERRLFASEKQVSYDMGSFLLTGRVDRIDEWVADGTLEIIDYKSGREMVIEDDVREAVAMTIYQLIVKRNWPDRRVLATIHALRGGVSATVELTSDDLDRWEDTLRGIGMEIEETDFDAVRPKYVSEICGECDFYRRCRPYFERDADD